MSGKIIKKLHFDIVHGCPMACVGCPMSTRREKLWYADPTEWGKCLQNIDVKHVELFRLFNFSDPLLHPRFPEFLEQIKRQKWKVDEVEISTTGQFYNRNMLKEALKLKVLNNIFVSCDGDGTKEEYERLRPPSKWGKLMYFLEDVPTYAKIHLGIRSICPDKAARSNWKFPKPWKPIFRTWKDMPEARTSHRTKEIKNGLCRYLSGKKGELLYVDADGTVVGCCIHPKPFLLGNLRENTYREILKSDTRKQIVWQLKNDRLSMPICGRCEE